MRNTPPLAVGDIPGILARTGLILRGGFDFKPGEWRPAGGPATSVLLVGNAGADYWPHFERWRAMQPRDLPNPLDTWSRQVAEEVARTIGARVVMPSDRPYAPFQQWAMRAEGLKPSPLGILMHPHFGLWHAYRAALLLDVPLPPEVASLLYPAADHACDQCTAKPCLNACPVDAFVEAGFAYERCVGHVRGPSGHTCRSGCLARNACPVGAGYRYDAHVQRFHMDHFAR